MIKHQWHIPIWWNVTIFIALFEKEGELFNDWKEKDLKKKTPAPKGRLREWIKRRKTMYEKNPGAIPARGG